MVLTTPASMGASAQQAPLRPTGVAATEAKTPAKQPARPAGTTFIVGLGAPIDINDVEIQSLKNPNRLLIDLPQMVVRLPNQPPENAPVGVVKSFRHMASAPGKMRIVIDVTRPVVFEKDVERLPDGRGYRLVVSIVAGKVPAPTRAISPSKRFKQVIVIDPGHGGHDSGARKYGTIEKDVVLSFSLKLREKLGETGLYKVVMTRDTDVFLPLAERRQIAERSQATLFIAIHADYAWRASARGATIYSLRPHVAATLKRAAGDVAVETAGKQLALAAKAGADTTALKGILAEKARDVIERTHDRTGILARSLIKYVGDSTNLMDNPDRKAGFAVLRTAKVPAILLELGYITNHEDAAQLKSDEWRDRVASALVTAINQYTSKCFPGSKYC